MPERGERDIDVEGGQKPRHIIEKKWGVRLRVLRNRL